MVESKSAITVAQAVAKLKIHHEAFCHFLISFRLNLAFSYFPISSRLDRLLPRLSRWE